MNTLCNNLSNCNTNSGNPSSVQKYHYPSPSPIFSTCFFPSPQFIPTLKSQPTNYCSITCIKYNNCPSNSQRLNLVQRGLTLDQQNQLNTNPPILCFFHGNTSICQGCSNKFTLNMKYPPNDLVKMLVVKPRLINGKWQPGSKKSWGYFHLNINCISEECKFCLGRGHLCPKCCQNTPQNWPH